MFLPRVDRHGVLCHHRCVLVSQSQVNHFLISRTHKSQKEKNKRVPTQVMSVQEDICVYCRSPQPRRRCKYCPSHRDSLKMKGDVIRELQLKLLGFQELQLKHCRLESQHKRLLQQFDQLKDVYYNQIVLIEKLKTIAIENIGKRLISFLFKQSEE